MLPEETRKEMKQSIGILEAELQEIIDTRKEEMKSLQPTVTDPNLPSDFEKMSHTEIHYYVQGLKEEINQLREMVNSNLIWRKNMYRNDEIWEAQRIIRHWKKLHDHFEKNPSVKEEWEALMMAIKLTEDD